MRVWFDTEFIEDGRTIELISIGMIREDGATYYAENRDCDITRASEWVLTNVVAHLEGGAALADRAEIAAAIQAFAGPNPEFWAYYADYDWVVLCQLYGTMMDLPKGWPMFCMDLKQLTVSVGNPTLPQQASQEHNALNDARWCKEAWEFIFARCL
jgi:hypothetical protein